MGRYKTYDVEASLEDWDDDELLEEIKSRGITAVYETDDDENLLYEIWRLRRNGSSYDDFNDLLDKYISNTLGVVL